MENPLYEEEMAEGGMEEMDESKSTAQTAVLPRSFFESKDPQPGDVCKVRVIDSGENEIRVEYESSEESDDFEEAPAEPEDPMMIM